MTAADSTQVDLHAAADQFVTQYDHAFRLGSPDTAALRAALDAVLQALACDAAPMQLQEVRSAVQEALEAYDRRRGTEPDGARAEAMGRAAHIRAVFDRALVPFDRHTDLAAAQAEVDQLQAEYREALAELERAVADADVTRVMALRGDVEVGLPGRVGAARIRLLELQVAMAEAQEAAPVRRVPEFVAAVDGARDALAEAERRADLARGDLYVAQHVQQQAAGFAQAAAARATSLRADLRALVDHQEQDQQRRLRRLAGLPEPQQAAS